MMQSNQQGPPLRNLQVALIRASYVLMALISALAVSWHQMWLLVRAGAVLSHQIWRLAQKRFLNAHSYFPTRTPLKGAQPAHTASPTTSLNNHICNCHNTILNRQDLITATNGCSRRQEYSLYKRHSDRFQLFCGSYERRASFVRLLLRARAVRCARDLALPRRTSMLEQGTSASSWNPVFGSYNGKKSEPRKSLALTRAL